MALGLGEGDAAGDGLAVGLVAGATVLLGAVDAAGLAVVVGEFELSVESVAQAAAKTSENTVRTSRAVRLIMLIFGELISLWPRFSKIEKHADICPYAN